jgi:hypothetical protein
VDLTRYFDPDMGIDWAIAHAEGMIACQADVPIASAVRALDDYCRVHGETRQDVAIQVVERRLRFGP